MSSSVRLAYRLGVRDLRRRTSETLLLLVAVTVAASTLTIGLALHGQTAQPYEETRTATLGPDVIAATFPLPGKPIDPARERRLAELRDKPGVVGSAGPFVATWASLRTGHVHAVAEVQGRSPAPTPVDRPHVVDGTWVRRGGVVIERAFAQALGVSVGDRVALAGRELPVVGVAVSAALPAYPQLCTFGCILDDPSWHQAQPGLIWTDRATVDSLATAREPLVHMLYLRLRDPDAATAFAADHTARSPAGPFLQSWQDVARRHAELLRNERALALLGSSLLIVLALATVVVLVGGRMADEVRRIGTLKALGATPGFVVRTLLAEYACIGLAAGMLGVLVGRLVTPLLVTPSAGLLGTRGPTTITPTDAVAVTTAMVAIVVLASLVPAWRAARTSTVRALADAGRRPRRIRVLILVSSWLPPAGLLGLRLTSRRPRRAVLTAVSLAIAVAGSVVVLYARASLASESGPAGGPADPTTAQLRAVMTALTVLLSVMAAVNLVFTTRTAAAEARGTLAVVRALGASPAETATGLAVAQLVPAMAGVLVGLGTGAALFRSLASHHPAPSPLAFAALVALTLLLTAGLTAVPTRLEARRPVADVLRDS
jgi:ABC-type lipoprotein release transport system permease subunit